MTTKELYDEIGANYDEVVHRLIKESLVQRFVIKFAKDDSTFEQLCQTMQEKDYKEAFKAAHTLKGVTLNLALTNLSTPTCELTENLRAGGDENAPALFEKVKEQYELTIAKIKEYEASAE